MKRDSHRSYKSLLTVIYSIFFTACFCCTDLSAEQSFTYIVTDNLGSPILATSESGDVLWREDYGPYGAQLTNEDGDNSVGFTGHQEDKSLGLTYMQARWYHSDTARFMAMDPVRFVESNPISFNRYAYANNNPYKYIDPNGELPVLAILVVAYGAEIGLSAAINAGIQYYAFGDVQVGGVGGVIDAAGDAAMLGPVGLAIGAQAAVSRSPTNVANIGEMGRSVGSAFNKSATPSGRPLSNHAFESLKRHGFKNLQQVDDIIKSATHRISQSDGATAFVQKVGRGGKTRFNIVIEGERGIVTGMRNFTKQEVRNMARNQGWESLPF